MRVACCYCAVIQNKLNEAEDKLVAQNRDAQKQIDAANRDRDNAVDALNTAQRQLNDVNNRLLELAGSGPSQAHPVTGEADGVAAALLIGSAATCLLCTG